MCMLPVQLPGEHIQRHMLVPLSERRCASTHYLLGAVIKSASLTPRLEFNWLPLVALVIHLIQAMRKHGCCFVCVQYAGCFGTRWWKKCGLHRLAFFVARRMAEWQGVWEVCKTSVLHSQQIITEVVHVITTAALGPAPPEHRSLEKDHLLSLLPSWSNKYISCEKTLLWDFLKSASPNSPLQTSFLFLAHQFSLHAISCKDLCTDSFPYPLPRQAVTSVLMAVISLQSPRPAHFFFSSKHVPPRDACPFRNDVLMGSGHQKHQRMVLSSISFHNQDEEIRGYLFLAEVFGFGGAPCHCCASLYFIHCSSPFCLPFSFAPNSVSPGLPSVRRFILWQCRNLLAPGTWLSPGRTLQKSSSRCAEDAQVWKRGTSFLLKRE